MSCSSTKPLSQADIDNAAQSFFAGPVSDGYMKSSSNNIVIATTIPVSDIVMNSPRLLGRTTTGRGTVEEITVTGGLTFSGGTLSGPALAVWGEIPTGAIDGVNTVFTTSQTYSSGKIAVYLNGLRLRGSADYTESSSTTITFTTAPVAGDTVLVDYQPA